MRRADGWSLAAYRAEKAAQRAHARRGLAWEATTLAMLEVGGFVVERCSSSAPFDAVVDGRRVDVKSARWTDYPQTRGRVRGYVFTNLKQGADCDVFLLICHDGERVQAVFVVPAAVVYVETVTITPATLRGEGKWSQYRDAWQRLSASCGALRVSPGSAP